MQFTPSTEQAVLHDAVHRYLSDNYSFQQRRAMLQHAPGLSRERWRAIADLGWLGTGVSESFGGSGGSLDDTAVIASEFGHFLVLEPLLACAVLPACLLRLAATADQCSELLPDLVSGKQLFAVAHSEPAARGEALFVETRATPLAGGRHLLTGRKSVVISGGDADRIIVSARTENNINIFLLDPSLPGITCRRFLTIDDRVAADFILNDVEVGADALLGTDGTAAANLERVFDHFIVAGCAEAVGIMDAVVSMTADYLKTRKAYGSVLSSFQALQHRLADMLAELELSRSMLVRALYALSVDDDQIRRKNVSGARILIGRAGRFVASSGIQLHGAMGVVDEHIIGNYLKRLSVTFALCGSVSTHLRRYTAIE
jgi:hypothetical protein